MNVEPLLKVRQFILNNPDKFNFHVVTVKRCGCLVRWIGEDLGVKRESNSLSLIGTYYNAASKALGLPEEDTYPLFNHKDGWNTNISGEPCTKEHAEWGAKIIDEFIASQRKGKQQ